MRGPLITGTAGLDGIDAAFASLGLADKHAKILIDPTMKGGSGV